MITTFWGDGDPKDNWFGILLIATIIIIGMCLTLLWYKGPKYSKKVTKYIPLPLVLIIVGLLFSGGGLYDAPENFTTALDFKVNWLTLIEDKWPDTYAAWNLTGWTQQSNTSDMVRWAALIGSSFLLFYAGFTLDLKLFKKYGLTAVLISTLPILIEGALFALLITPVLYLQQANSATNYSWAEFNWAIPFFIGYGIAAVSPGIVVPLLVKFQKMGYGKYNKINEIAIICASLDDVTSLGLILVFFSLVIGVQTGGLSESVGSTFTILLGRIPVMIFLSIIIAFATFFVFIFWVKGPLDKFVPHETEIMGKKIKIWNILALIGLVVLIIAINEMCQHAMQGAFENLYDDEANSHFMSWIFPNSLIAFLVFGMLVANKFHKDVKDPKQEANIKTFAVWVPTLWLFFFAPILFANTGGLIIFTWVWKWITLLYIAIIIFCIITGRSIGARIALYDREKFKWNDVEVITALSWPKGTTTAAAMTFIVLMVVFAGQANAENWVLINTLVHPLFDIAIAGIIVTIPTNELVFNVLYKKYMPLTEEGEKPSSVPMPIFGPLNVHYKKINAKYKAKYRDYKEWHSKNEK